jgi:sortase A
VTATIPDREGAEAVVVAPPPADPRSTRRRRATPKPAPSLARPPRPGDELWTVMSTGGAMVALVCLWVLAQVLFLSGLSQARSQDLLYSELRTSIAGDPNTVAPVGPTVPVGDPVALLSVPRLGISQVVVEGTSSSDTLAGPGHLRRTVLPGQTGTSVVFGRAATYGAPFAEIGELRPGDTIDVTMAQGSVSYEVVGVRRAGDALPQPLPAGQSRLVLATATGSGPLAALTPGDVLYVDADAPKGFNPPSGLPTAVPESEQLMQSDPGVYPLLALHLALLLAVTLGIVAARQRWSAPLVWIVATPVALALAWSTTDVVMRLLPNVV